VRSCSSCLNYLGIEPNNHCKIFNYRYNEKGHIRQASYCKNYKAASIKDIRELIDRWLREEKQNLKDMMK